jgi:PAS domain S-box-containing protein
MVDQRGDLICFPDESLLGRSVFAYRLRWFSDANQEDMVLAGLLDGNPGVASFVSDRKTDEKTMMAWSPVNLGDTRWSIAVCMNYNEQISGPLREYAQNNFIMMACFLASMTMGGAMYFRFERKKSQLQAHLALGRVNDELQLLSFEHSQTEQDLQSQVRQLKSVIEAIPCGLCWKDRKGVYRGANSVFARMAGQSHPDAIRGKTDTDLAGKRTIAGRMDPYDQEVIKTGIPLLNVEMRQSIQGKAATLLASKVPLTDLRGGIVGILGVYVDITDLKRLHNSKEIEWRRWNEVLDRMGMGVVLADGAGMIREINDGAIDAVGQSRSELIGRSIAELIPPAYRKEVESWLDNVREGQTPATNRRQIPLGDREMEVCLAVLSREGKITGLWMTLVDVTDYARGRERAEYANYRTGRFLAGMSYQIRTAMNSILGFAELYLQEELGGQQKPFIKQITENASQLRGIADELAKLSRQETAGNVEIGRIAGMPMGMNADKEEIKDESLKIEPKPDSTASPSPQETTDPITTGQDLRILVVDDVPENRALLEVILKKAGYQVVSASNGQEAIDLAAKQVFDMILMDMQMPIVNGYDATRRIRNGKHNSNTVILGMTASVEKGDELKCLDAGCDDFVGKPIKKDLLLRKIWRYMEQNKQLAAAGRGEPIVSFLKGDPDYQKTIEMFVNNLPSRLQEMHQAFDEGNLKELAVKVHALKGLGGFAGFPVFTEKAKILEGTIHTHDLEKIRFQLDEMADLCRRTRIENR